MTNATLQSKDKYDAETSERLLSMRFEEFVRVWAPADDANRFYAELHMLIRAVHADAAKPYEQAMSRMMAAMPLMYMKDKI